MSDQVDQNFTACYISCCDPGWGVTETSLIHTIQLPPWVEPDLGGEVISIGDWIGAFYLNDNQQEVCGGALKWESNVLLELKVFGDDYETSQKDGFAIGEDIRWKIFQCQSGETYDAFALYDSDFPNDDGTFIPFGLSQITDLSNGQAQEVTIREGWSGVSSYIDPFDKSLEHIFENNSEDLTILSNFDGMFYPAQNINTLNGWEFTAGYSVKAMQDFIVSLKGSEHDGYSLALGSGWSIVPVISTCHVAVSEVFVPATNTQIVKEVASTGIYWPDYAINTIGQLAPGKAYYALLDNDGTIIFPECMKSGWFDSEAVMKSNNITIWNDLVQTPQSHLVMIPSEVIQNLELEIGDYLGGFTIEGRCYGTVQIKSEKENHCLTLYGDDIYTDAKDGFAEGDPILIRQYQTQKGKEKDQVIGFDPTFPNQGYFASHGVSALKLEELSVESSENTEMFNFNLFPNPSKEKITLSWSQENLAPAKVRIFNTFGQLVEELSVNVSHSGVQTYTMDVSKLEQGTYMVNLRSGQRFGMKKLIIMK
jgi:hypothetical protein